MLEIITAFLVVLSCVFTFFAKKHSQPFPGPRGFPLCGVAFQVDKERLHLSLYEWTKTYGEIFQFDVFGKTYVSLNSPEVMREVMGQEPTATITASREPTFFGNYIIAKDTDIIFSSYSRDWVQRRKVGSQIMQAYGEGMFLLKDEIFHILQDVKDFIRNNERQDIDPDHLVETYLLKDLASLVTFYTYSY